MTLIYRQNQSSTWKTKSLCVCGVLLLLNNNVDYFKLDPNQSTIVWQVVGCQKQKLEN